MSCDDLLPLPNNMGTYNMGMMDGGGDDKETRAFCPFGVTCSSRDVSLACNCNWACNCDWIFRFMERVAAQGARMTPRTKVLKEMYFRRRTNRLRGPL